MTIPRLRGAVAAAAALLVLAGCGGGGSADRGAPTTPTPSAPVSSTPAAGAQAARPGKLVPLRPGEKRLTLRMPTAYTPSAPTGVGTDDYRCFLLDPHLVHDGFLTGTNVLPGNPAVVHHVILFRVDPRQVAEARRRDASEPGEGWTCFGGTGLAGDFTNLDDANWLGAWAPGGRETVARPGYGVDLPRGSQIIMQVHYNLLAGDGPDTSAAQIRIAPGSAGLTPLHTMLLPAPVELPCRPGQQPPDVGVVNETLAPVFDPMLKPLVCRQQPTAPVLEHAGAWPAQVGDLRR